MIIFSILRRMINSCKKFLYYSWCLANSVDILTSFVARTAPPCWSDLMAVTTTACRDGVQNLSHLCCEEFIVDITLLHCIPCAPGHIYPSGSSDWWHWQGSSRENGMESRHGTWQT